MARNPGVRDLGEYASYHKLASFLGKKDARTIAHNTVVVRVSDSQIGVILHSTRILTFDLIGNVTLNSGGYHTVTTKQRLNQFLRPHGWSVEQKKYEWYVRGPNGEKEEFSDHMVLSLGSTLHPSSLGYGGPLRRENRGQRGTPQRPSPDDQYPHPGKFEGQTMLAVEMYDAAMESGADAEDGDSEGPGYYWLFMDFIASDGTPRHGILSEDSQGFIVLDEFDTATDAEEAWDEEVQPLMDEWARGGEE